MISVRKYADGADPGPSAGAEPSPRAAEKFRPATHPGVDLLVLMLAAYRNALRAIGQAGEEVCPPLRGSLDRGLAVASGKMAAASSAEQIAGADAAMQDEVEQWAHAAAGYYGQKAAEVKEILLTIARASDAVAERDERCSLQLHAVTSDLERIGSFEDISRMRASIEQCALHLRASVERMTAEGQAALTEVRRQLSALQSRVEDAQQIATVDSVTGLGNRLWLEAQIEQRMAAGAGFCVALLDFDGFKSLHAFHGHLVGNDVLKQFAGLLRAVCRSGDGVGRWSGDEFLILLDSPREEAQAQMERVRKWICGRHTVQGRSGPMMVTAPASIGLVSWEPPETMNKLLERAGAAMGAGKGARGLDVPAI